MTNAERAVYESTPIPLAFFVYQQGRFRPNLVSDGYCALAGMDRALLMRLLDSRMLEQVHPEDIGTLAEIGERFARREITKYDVSYRSRLKGRANYSEIYTVGQWVRMADGAEEALLEFTNLSQRQSQPTGGDTSADLYFRDSVTDLPNLNYARQYADETMQEIRRAGKTPALLYFDVRSMAVYNYAYGYARGNELLATVARVIAEAFPGALVCRGESDHILAIDVCDDLLAAKVLRINETVKQMARGSTAGIQCAIVRMPNRLKAVEGLDRARRALKKNGTNLNVVCCVYSDEDEDRYELNRYILQHFEAALEQHWIRVFYQPILDTMTPQVTALEGLSRWIDPVRGLITPGKFIPVLSKYHLLYKLDLYMVEQICRELPLRKQSGLHTVPVTVNFSAQDFDCVDVVDALNRAVERHGLERSDIIVEITEQDLAQAAGHFQAQLLRIHNSGYRLWIDDFGTGYSSLNVFGQYHIDRIKFDSKLLRHLDDNHGANRVIMKHIVEMCREIGVHTLAEGVETEQQHRYLEEIDCELAQGFYFGRPEPMEQAGEKAEHQKS